MGQLIEKAEELDEANGLTQDAIEVKRLAVRDWKLRIAKLNAAMIRHSDNPPTEYDLKKLKLCEHFFKK